MTIINILLLIAIWNMMMSIVNKQKTNRLYCGLIGFSGKTNFDKEKINLLMLWNSFERGKDATGIYTPKNGLVKFAKLATEFLVNTPFEEDTLLIAHVRAKTVGTNTDKNAHPFNEDNVVLAHNGTLKNHYDLLRKYKLEWNKYDVDSHVICGIMAQEKNFKVLTEIEGAAAMLMHDKDNPKIMYVFRNGDRDLFKGYCDGNLYISSIKNSLELIGCKNVKEFKENYLYTIVDGLIQGTAKRIVNKPYNPPKPAYTSNYVPSSDKLIGIMLQFDQWNQRTMLNNLTYKKEYKVIGFDKGKYTITIVDDNGINFTVSSYYFNRMDAYFTVHDTVKSRCNIVLKSDPNTVIIAKDENCLITKDYMNGYVELINLKTNEIYDLSKSFLKKLTDFEVKALEDNKEESEQLNLALNFCEGYDQFMKNVDTKFNNSNVNQEEEEEDLETEEEDDESYYDMSINEAKFVEDLENIKRSSDELIDFVSTSLVIPDDEVINYKQLKMTLSMHIDEVLEFYNVKEDAK